MPEEALKQFKDTEDWRKENHLEELYNTIDVKEYDETRRLVCLPYFPFSMRLLKINYSTLNGPVAEIAAGYQ
jgi:hypothetical protein